MTQIKFRGFRTDGKGWVEGGIKYDDCDVFIIAKQGNVLDASIQIHPSSLGQFTGQTDKNGKEIFGAIGEKGGDVDKSGRVVKYSYGSFILSNEISGDYALIGDCEFCEIIGNQFEQDNGN